MTKIVEGGPECMREDCIVTESGKFTTMTYFNQERDANGNLILNDRNLTTSTKHCLSCGKTWTQSVQNGFITNWSFV